MRTVAMVAAIALLSLGALVVWLAQGRPPAISEEASRAIQRAREVREAKGKVRTVGNVSFLPMRRTVRR